MTSTYLNNSNNNKKLICGSLPQISPPTHFYLTPIIPSFQISPLSTPLRSIHSFTALNTIAVSQNLHIRLKNHFPEARGTPAPRFTPSGSHVLLRFDARNPSSSSFLHHPAFEVIFSCPILIVCNQMHILRRGRLFPQMP